MTEQKRDGLKPGAGRGGCLEFTPLRLALALILGLSLAACGTMKQRLGVSGFEPIYPRPLFETHFSPVLGGGKIGVSVPEVASLRPTLRWTAFPGAEAYPHNLKPFVAVDSARLGKVGYDLRVWRSNQGTKELVYERYGIEGPSHRLETPLQPAALYLWTVRARFEVDGKETVSEWSMTMFPRVLPPGKTRITNFEAGFIYSDVRAMARKLGYIPDANLFRFQTPNDASLVAQAAAGTETRGSGATSAPDEPPLRPRREVKAYLKRNRAAVREQLAVYNRAYGLVPVPGTRGETVTEIQSLEVKELYGKDAVVEIVYEVRDDQEANSGRYRFELEWQGDALVFIGHRPATNTGASDKAAPPLHSRQEVRAYLQDNEDKLLQKLSDYNRLHKVVAARQTLRVSRIYFYRIEDLVGDTVVLAINFVVGVEGSDQETTGQNLFDLIWIGGELEIVAHRPT